MMNEFQMCMVIIILAMYLVMVYNWIITIVILLKLLHVLRI